MEIIILSLLVLFSFTLAVQEIEPQTNTSAEDRRIEIKTMSQLTIDYLNK